MTLPQGEPLSRTLQYRVGKQTATTTTLKALPAANASRADGSLTVVLADYSLWVFDLDSTAAASDRVLVPTAGNGRYLLAADSADVLTLRPGVPMQNRLRMLGSPAKIVQGDTVTIGADVYEFRDDTPPTGGTAGRIWVYNGAASTNSRANFIKAINGVVDAALIAEAVATETLLAAAGVTTGDVIVQSATAVGGSAAPSTTATATTEVLTSANDIWDHTTMQYGVAAVPTQSQHVVVTLGAEELAKTTFEVYFDFVPTGANVVNRSRPHNEVVSISGKAVTCALTGGGSPNHQSGDVVDVTAWA